MKVSKLIKDCGHTTCPLYSKYFNKINAQSTFRIEHYRWSNIYKPKILIKNDNKYGAKLLLIMESPPPKFNEYIYGSEGGFKKTDGLFRCVTQALIEVEKPNIINLSDKDYWLRWISNKGLYVIDGIKCRKILFDPIRTEEITSTQLKNSFNNCRDILKCEIETINPFRIVIGIVSLYETNIVQSIVRDLSMKNRFIDERIKSPFRKNADEFIGVFKNVWKKVLIDFDTQ